MAILRFVYPSINIFPVAYFCDQYQEILVLDLINYSVVSNPQTVQLLQANQGFRSIRSRRGGQGQDLSVNPFLVAFGRAN